MSRPPFFESSYPLEPFNGELEWLLFFMYFFAILACKIRKMVYSMRADRKESFHHNHKETMR